MIDSPISVPGGYSFSQINSMLPSFTTAPGIPMLSAASPTQVKVNEATIKLGDTPHHIAESTFTVADKLDTGVLQAGKDYKIYLVAPGGVPDFRVSLNNTWPDGFNADNSRKIGGFHSLCVDVGTIAGHPLSGLAATEILPDSVWSLNHRPTCEPDGMVYSIAADLWVDIYLQSGTGTSTASVYGGTVVVSHNWYDFVDDLAAVGKRLLWQSEFMTIAAGSPEEVNIQGSTAPGTAGGHVATNGQRIISNCGVDGAVGEYWQWLLDLSYRLDPVPSSGDPLWGLYNLPGSRGSLYRQGDNGLVRLLAGGSWNYGSYAGSRSAGADFTPWWTGSALAARGCARSRGGA